ncbi:DUF5302 domain-containing protein [Actinotalea sp.]|uniref:DUF5302 domain-containing protein n=1 Tax=Actinotalea sp. TaxID=1872145 RepID=UPI00356316A8
MSEDSSTAATAEGPGGDGSASTDPKERFRQALERKNAAGHRTADGVRGGSAVHGSEVAGGGKRTFRRKTG